MASWGDIFNEKTLPYIATGAAAGVGALASSKAAGKQAAAAREATQLQREIFEQQQANLQPYLDAGIPALNAMSYGLGLGPAPGAGAPENAMLQSSDPLLQFSARPGGSGAVGDVLTGAGTGMTFGGPIGAGIGGAIGGISNLFGRGRTQANQIVPHQEALDQEMARISSLIESGQIGYGEGLAHMENLTNQFYSMAGRFDRAGQGAVDTISGIYDPVFDAWRGAAANEQPANAMLAPGVQGPGGLGYGEFLAPFDYQEEPGYQFGLQRGLDQLEASASARGSLGSGGTLKALERYRNDYATSKYNDAFNRFQSDRANRWGMLGDVAGIGTNAAQQANTAAGAYGVNAGNMMLGRGEAEAGGTLGVGGAIQQGLGGAADIYGQQQQNALLNAILQGG